MRNNAFLPSKPCRATANLTGKVFSTAGQAALALHVMAIGQVAYVSGWGWAGLWSVQIAPTRHRSGPQSDKSDSVNDRPQYAISSSAQHAGRPHRNQSPVPDAVSRPSHTGRGMLVPPAWFSASLQIQGDLRYAGQSEVGRVFKNVNGSSV